MHNAGSGVLINRLVFCSLLIAGMLIGGMAQATLVDRGGGLIYDSEQNITWLQNPNLLTSNRINFYQAISLARAFEYIDVTRDVIWSGWRLSDAFELLYLHTRYGVTGVGPDALPFLDLHVRTPYGPYESYWGVSYDSAWSPLRQFSSVVDLGTGSVSPINGEYYYFYAWAVRPGDVGPLESSSAVPEPGAFSLFSIGLALIGFGMRRKN